MRTVSGRAAATYLAVAVCLLIAVVGAAVWSRSVEPADAATPPALAYASPIPGRQRLMRIVAQAERHATDDEPDLVEYLEIRSWVLDSNASDGQTVSAVRETTRESWRTLDNAGRIIERQPRPDTGRAAGLALPGRLIRTQEFAAGAYPARWLDRPPVQVDRLARWFRQDQPGAELAPAIVDLLNERVLRSQERVALLRLLGQIPGVNYRGLVAVRGSAARGEAFSVNSDASGLPTQYTFVINPLTGAFLASDRMLTQNAGRLNVRIPAVVGYDTYAIAGYATEIGARGA